jgi:hypothetical protein
MVTTPEVFLSINQVILWTRGIQIPFSSISPLSSWRQTLWHDSANHSGKGQNISIQENVVTPNYERKPIR